MILRIIQSFGYFDLAHLLIPFNAIVDQLNRKISWFTVSFFLISWHVSKKWPKTKTDKEQPLYSIAFNMFVFHTPQHCSTFLRGDNHLWPTTRKYTVRCVLFNVLQPNPRGSSMACTATWISTHATKARPLISDTSHNRSNFLRPLRCYSTTWWKHRSTTTCHGATHSLRPT